VEDLCVLIKFALTQFLLIDAYLSPAWHLAYNVIALVTDLIWGCMNYWFYKELIAALDRHIHDVKSSNGRLGDDRKLVTARDKVSTTFTTTLLT